MQPHHRSHGSHPQIFGQRHGGWVALPWKWRLASKSAVSNHSPTAVVSRAWYGASIAEFRSAQPDLIFGILAKNPEFDLATTQKEAWEEQIAFLQKNLDGLSGTLFLEFNIPRMGSRVDAILLIGPLVFLVEFKVGKATFDRTDVDQVWDYALDLKNFHESSHQVPLVPILVATETQESVPIKLVADKDRVYRPMQIHPSGFRVAIELALEKITGEALDQSQWAQAPYKPTPTIVEAARALYAHHGVAAIKAFDAGKKNLGDTSRRIEELINEAKTNGRKIICFLTGVPGAGKTLVGLNVATQHVRTDNPTHAVLLSGNGPLVAVLRAALSRDEKVRLKKAGQKQKKGSDPVKQ
ncbi:MAG TPA: DNA/RNA helicase domain-containing protein, partial [Opitutaceae bacterium]|nr:DNA/RNA helicase domain-containing protein [Opitutaceae bacterium]